MLISPENYSHGNKPNQPIEIYLRSGLSFPGFIAGLHTLEFKKFDDVTRWADISKLNARGPEGLNIIISVPTVTDVLFLGNLGLDGYPYIYMNNIKYTTRDGKEIDAFYYYYLTKEGKVIQAIHSKDNPMEVLSTQEVSGERLSNLAKILDENNFFG
ncbi:MAG: hypothetical protein NZ866_00470 [Patescibacteria group bacterium]|nr:hypothetical protein [Patescibacteria group bacterium]